MNLPVIDEMLNETKHRLDQTIDAVVERGYEDLSEEFDDYSDLLEMFEFRKLVTFEIYEAYFPPKRHEFELQIVTEIVEAVVKSKSAVFLGVAALSGLVGGTTYDLTRRLLSHVVSKFRKDKRLSGQFREIYQNIEAIQEYFESRKQAKLEGIAAHLDIDPQRLTPLLKLLGFKCKRSRKRQVWIKPRS